jgi:hypothetical protein
LINWYERVVVGDYEGLKSSEIKKINPNWSIWKDGSVLLFGLIGLHLYWVGALEVNL